MPCYHCGSPVLEQGRWRALILGEERALCCAGCAAVAATIVAGGFERYYATRAVHALAPLGTAQTPASAYDDPAAQPHITAPAGAHLVEATLILDRIRCAACLWLNQRVLRAVPGVRRADVNFATQRAHIAWDPRRTRLSALIEAIRGIGYDAFPYDPQRQSALDRDARRKALWRLFVAGFGAMQVMMYAFPAYLDDSGGLSPAAETLLRWASLVLTLPVLAFSCGPFFSGAWRELSHWRPGMDTPIAIGVAGGSAASAWATVTGEGAVYFDSIAMLVFLLLGARYLELAARQRAAAALDRLTRWQPAVALRLGDEADPGSAQSVPAHQLAAGDAVLIAAGERIPADGAVLRGASSVDESLLTGETVPLAKSRGSLLSAGTVNLEQPLVMRVTHAGAQTRAAAIARLIERGAASRPQLVAAADRIAHVMTWVVLIVAALAGLYWGDAWVAIAVLVATCPCALALAAPLALTTAAARLLGRGIALTRASALETLSKATDVVLDKTGTLSAGKFAIARVQLLGAASEDYCLALACALEASSLHPLARAFDGPNLRPGPRSGPRPGPQPMVADLVNHAGCGMEAVVNGRRVRIGTQAFCQALAVSPAALVPRDAAWTPVFLADESGWLAAFLLEDSLRLEAPGLVTALNAAGLRVHLLSGDHPAAVGTVAGRLGIGQWSGGATPQDKFDYVERLQRAGRIVVMVGDGLNDAPVLARADASIAMGSGADAAQAQADFVLLAQGGEARLDAAADCFAVARRAMGIVRQNFAWALAYNACALPLAAAGWIGPWEAAIGMAASSFIVALNAMRVGAGATQG